MTSTQDDSVRPEEFAEAAAAAIADAQSHDFSTTAQVLAAAGLVGVCAQESVGGLGLGLAYAVPIAHQAGKLRLRFPLIEQMLVAKAFEDTPLAAEIVSGNKVVSIAWQYQAQQACASHAAYADHADWLLVPDEQGAMLVERTSVEFEASTQLDPEAPQFTVHLTSPSVVARLTQAQYEALLHDAHVLTAAFLNGAAQGAIEFTADYLSTRVQFGRPLTAKQAVRHTLARMKLLNEVSIAAVDRTLTTDEFGAQRDARIAWTGAVHNAIFVIERAIHLNGGMGFTWEVPLHWSLRDARRLDAAFKGSSTLQTVGKAFIFAAQETAHA